MAGTIRHTMRLEVTNDGFSDRFEYSSPDIVQAVIGGGNPGTLSIGTTEETISLAELTSPSFIVIKNLDDENFVDFGFSAGVHGMRLAPGMMLQSFLKPAATIYAKADTAACKVFVKAYEA